MPSRHQLFIEQSSTDIRTALLVDGDVRELDIERNDTPSVVGNVYRGQVTRVISGMQAAFVDIGLSSPGFLHRRDILKGEAKLETVLHQGQSLIVQVSQDPRKGPQSQQAQEAKRVKGAQDKGATLSADVKLIARSLIYLPCAPQSRVLFSKQFKSAASAHADQRTEPDRIKTELDAAMRQRSMPGSLIVRASALQETEHLDAQLSWLHARWNTALENQQRAPQLLLAELPHAANVVRDFVTAQQPLQLLVKDPQTAADLLAKADLTNVNEAQGCIEITAERFHDVSSQVASTLEQALSRYVTLENGGQLVFDHTEALTVVDVNTASAQSNSAQAGQSLYAQTNLLAAREVARQLRLRNIAGIVIVDFIDTDSASHKEVLRELSAHLLTDPMKTTCAANSNLGLIEITRERQRKGLHEQTQTLCGHCNGTGRMVMPAAVAQS